MLRRRLLMMVRGGFRWLFVRSKIQTGNNANLGTAPAIDVEAQAKIRTDKIASPEIRPAADVAASPTIQTDTKTSIETYPAADIVANKSLLVKVKKFLQAYIIGEMRYAKKIQNGATATMDFGQGVDAFSKRTIAPVDVSSVMTSSADSIDVAAVGHLDSDASTAIVTTANTTDLTLSSSAQTRSSAQLAFWIYPYYIEDGVLVIKQAYSITQNEDGSLEVR